MKRSLIIISITMILIFGCETYKEKGSPEYIKEVNDWHQKRIENLKKENGWLNLVGLFFLKEGENTFGSGKENDFVIDDKDLPEKICTFILKDTLVEMISDDNVNLMVDSVSVKRTFLNHDLTGKPTIVSYKSYRWFIIKRGDKFALRVRNLDAPLVKEFKGIERFPVNEDWKVTAEFIPYNPPKEVLVPSIIGIPEKEISPGRVRFQIKDKTYELEALDSGDKLFFVFADETNGKDTYGAGRFLYADKPDTNGKVILDFNKAYNPPCAFTHYATCPLPTPENFLKLRVTAGEKKFK
ncbi:MAG: DUF1684 domain-containing protein [Ignavibacteria bacterium]|jgi:uncharacterized protein (DUF1684 family)|nr:DUF1684 domain-containing protein [Ignavibacteria bacterium]MDH7528714.1 DUF1684 domain-containing protein [Ignavibacteria bacterium]